MEENFRVPRPTSETLDHSTNPSWRVFRIMAEFVDGFQFLTHFKKSVSIFGSAQLTPDSDHYKDAQRLARMLGEVGFTIITGGGPGIMEAANRGGSEAQVPSVGLNIQLPMEQRTNPFVNRAIGFHYFFTRKVMLSASSQAYVFFPGGLGTLNEFFEITTLIQTNKIERTPVVIIGKDYWAPLFEWLKKATTQQHRMMKEADLSIWQMVDTVEEAFEIVKNSGERGLF